MRLWKTFALAAFPLAAAFGVVTPATAQCLPGNYDAARGIKGGDCYTTPEMKKILQAYNQTIVISGDRVTAGDDAQGQVQFGKKLNVFTTSHDGRIGLNLEGDAPSGQASLHFSIGAVMSDVQIWDRNQPITVGAETIGRIFAENVKSKRTGDHLMLSAKCGAGVHCNVFVTGNKQTEGSFAADNGVKVIDLADMSGISYSPAGIELAKRQASH